MAKKTTKKTVAKKTATKKTGAKKKATTRKLTAAAEPASVTPAPAATPASAAISVEQVRVRAYEIYRSGRNSSNPDADWLQAEQELMAGIGS